MVVAEIAKAAAQNKAFVAITSQIRTIKGLVGTTVSASKGVLPYAVTQIYLERIKTIKRVKEAGCRVKATILSKVKKKASASTSCEFDLVFPGGS
jgi:RecA/RadA recombinase